MLVIRPQQWQEIADSLLEQAAFERAPRFFPAACEGLGRELRPLIYRSVRRARAFGFSAQSDALHFIYLAVILGERFDQELPWAARILNESDPLKRPFRASRLYEAAMRHLRAQERRQEVEVQAV